MDNERLTAIAAEVGQEYGIEASARFDAFKDVKIKWWRTNSTIELIVTDYMKDAPEQVIRSLISVILDRIYKDPKTDNGYPDEVKNYFMAPEFKTAHINTFFDRAGLTGKINRVVDGVTIVESNVSYNPTTVLSAIFGVVAIRSEYLYDNDFEQIAIASIKNFQAQFGQPAGVKA